MPWPRLSIRASVLLAIGTAVLLPTAALWHAEQRLTEEAYAPLITQNREAVLALTAAALVEPMWTLDLQRLQLLATRTVEQPAVLGLRISEARPLSPPLELGRFGQPPGSAGVMLRSDILHEGVRLGEVQIWFDDRQLGRALAERRQATLLQAALQMLLSLLLLVAVLYRRLVAPIERLKAQASAMAQRLPLPHPLLRRRDELGELSAHLGKVHGQVDELFAQLEAKQTELTQIALHDTLTGLPNRRLFAELGAAAVAAAQRDGQKLALLFIDIDRFKSVNDTLGHAAGDVLLQTLAQRLRAAVRGADVLCRHSGDEFLVLMHGVADWEEVAATAERLLRETEQPVPLGERSVVVSASIGIALFPDDASDHDALVRQADAAMYAAKTLGRARVSFWRSEFNAQLQATLALEQALQQALARGELLLHYQPQVDARSGRVCGCEALLRWQHPERGLLGPAEFVRAAEQCGLINELGRFVVRSACAQIAQWKAAGLCFGAVAVNVSALEFRQHRLIDTLTQAMAEHGVAPQELELELTESVLMSDTDASQRIVERVQALGIRLAVDDFGTGYSSLGYLKRLRPAKLKIDRSFVRDLPADNDDRVLVQAMVQMAGALGIQVVAEGVETEAQRQCLAGLGVQALQGYLTGRPMGAQALQQLVGRRSDTLASSYDAMI